MAQPQGPGQTTGFFKEARQLGDGDHLGTDGQEGIRAGRPWRDPPEFVQTPYTLAFVICCSDSTSTALVWWWWGGYTQPFPTWNLISCQEAEGDLWSQTHLDFLTYHCATKKVIKLSKLPGFSSSAKWVHLQ